MGNSRAEEITGIFAADSPYDLTKRANYGQDRGRILLCLDLRDGSVDVETRNPCDVGQSPLQYCGIIQTYKLPDDVDAEALERDLDCEDSPLHMALLAVYRACHCIDRTASGNPYPSWSLDSDMYALEGAVSSAIEQLDTHVGVHHVDEWWLIAYGSDQLLGHFGLTINSSKEELLEAATRVLEESGVELFEDVHEIASWLADTQAAVRGDDD